MGLIFFIFITSLDLTAAFFNIRMLLSCFSKNTKYTFLRNFRPLIICQFFYAVTILTWNIVGTWKKFQNEDECCYLLKGLSVSATYFLLFNTAILIGDNQPLVTNNLQLSRAPWLLLSSAVSLGFIFSAMLWVYNDLKRKINEDEMAIFFFFSSTVLFNTFMFLVAFLVHRFVVRQNRSGNLFKPEQNIAGIEGPFVMSKNVFNGNQSGRFLLFLFLLWGSISLMLLLKLENTAETVLHVFKVADRLTEITIPVCLIFSTDASSNEEDKIRTQGII